MSASRNTSYFAIAALTLATSFSAGSIPSARAQDTPGKPSPEKGLALAQKLCSNCHLVDGAPSSSVPAGVPPLRWIANRDAQTGQRIMDKLINPHWPMPDLRLSIEEIADVVAYLETIRTNKSNKPLEVPTPPVKPDRPSKS